MIPAPLDTLMMINRGFNMKKVVSSTENVLKSYFHSGKSISKI